MRLWEMMKQRLEPLRNAKRRVSGSDSDTVAPSSGLVPTDKRATAARPAGPAKPPEPVTSPRRPTRPQPAPTPASKTTFVAAAAPTATPIERRKSRQIAKGQRPIEAVLDLHGMRQREAHAALRRFIAQSQASGFKFVKVITGKGPLAGSADARTRPFDAPGTGERGDGERGVLKRLVPAWLREADMAALIVGSATAGRGHGGEGALYVELRRKGRALK
jgi:DNA-nicking Smr family endonuclease